MLHHHLLLILLSLTLTQVLCLKWDPFRFLKTVAFFNLKNPFTTMTTASTASNNNRSIPAGQRIWSKTENPLGLSWAPLDDVVMGGVSRTDLVSGKSNLKTLNP